MFDITSKPRYNHDCDNCKFLGCYKEFDVYWCVGSQSIGGGSIILRFSDVVNEYISSPVSCVLYADEYDEVMIKVAKYLLRKGYLSLKFNEECVKKDEWLMEDLWSMRK